MQEFNAKIIEAKTKGGAYIEIPFNVEEVYGAKRVKVIASFDGVQYRGSLVKMGTDCHIIGIKKEIREQIGKTIFEQHPQHLEFWNSLSYSVQKKNIDSINSAKKEETRAKRLATLLQKIQNKEK